MKTYELIDKIVALLIPGLSLKEATRDALHQIVLEASKAGLIVEQKQPLGEVVKLPTVMVARGQRCNLCNSRIDVSLQFKVKADHQRVMQRWCLDCLERATDMVKEEQAKQPVAVCPLCGNSMIDPVTYVLEDGVRSFVACRECFGWVKTGVTQDDTHPGG